MWSKQGSLPSHIKRKCAAFNAPSSQLTTTITQKNYNQFPTKSTFWRFAHWLSKLIYYHSMSYFPPSAATAVIGESTATFATMAHNLLVSIQYGDQTAGEKIIRAWVARLTLPTSSPYRLSAGRTIAFADHQGIPDLFGPACLAYIIETPLSTDTWPIGAVVSTFSYDPDVPLTDSQRVRLLLGYYELQTSWVELRTVPHARNQCTAGCLASWLFQWSLIDRKYSGQANIVVRVEKLREDLLSIGRGSMGQFMTNACWNTALRELDAMLDDFKVGASFFGA
jgi:hypothetical protein